MTKPPVDLPLPALAPSPLLFTHWSTLHGQGHVSRVMVHAFRLIEATGWIEDAPRLWASVYLHDLARTHDGVCHRHGADAIKEVSDARSARVVREGRRDGRRLSDDSHGSRDRARLAEKPWRASRACQMRRTPGFGPRKRSAVTRRGTETQRPGVQLPMSFATLEPG